jgi:4-methylaminobutanoate oxidase (formaldehyde-forming)
MHRVPSLQKVGIRKFFNGPESFTADQRYIMGPAPELKNFFVAAGFNSIGIQSGGGAGMALAHWIVDGEPPLDLWDVDIRRLQPHMGRKSFLVPRVSEALGLLYAMHWPYRQFESSRNVRQTAFYEDWKAMGACFGEVAGWERPNWYAPKGVLPKYEYSYGRQNWFAYAGEDVKATRERVALYDLSTFAKFLLVGRDAETLLQRVSCADIGSEGRATYTQWLNEKGGIEADLTVTRISATRFMVVTAAATSTRDWYYLKDRIEPGMDVELIDMTTAHAALGVMGPKSRELLARVTDADLSNAAFPFGSSKHVVIGNAKVRATRISYVGELGWELYIPAEFARGVLRDIIDADADLGLRPAGMHAMDACRIEKAYRHWGHDIGTRDTILEAGLGFTCAFDKKVPFIGRDAVLRQKEAGKLGRRMVQFRMRDPDLLLYHNEPIYRDGQLVGLVTSANYGHHLGGAIGMGYVHSASGVDAAFIGEGKFEIGVAMKRHPADASLAPMYDPKSARMRA